jgi:putative heme-binding domain-containing protein
LTAIGDQADPNLIRASSETGRGVTTVSQSEARVESLRRFALGHPGDARKGEELFFKNKSIGCARCHSAGGRGKAKLGPDLSGIALKYDKAEIIRSVLEPSDRIAIGYEGVRVSTRDGNVLIGQSLSETQSFLELVDAELKVTQVSKSEVQERRPTKYSLMPAGLINSLSPIELTDLIAYIGSLRQPSDQGNRGRTAPSETP